MAINASIFDFIDGNKETKQTNSLSYIFLKYPDLVDLFIQKLATQTQKKLPNLKDNGLRTSGR